MTNFQKNLITGLVIIFIAICGIKFIIPHILKSWDVYVTTTNTVKSLRGALDFANKANADLKEQYDNVISESTIDRDRLEKRLNEMYQHNDSLQNKINGLKGQLTGIHTGEGDIDIGDTLKAVENDSIITAHDDFIDVSYYKKDSTISWNLAAIIKLEGIEKTDIYGNRRQIENVYLESKRSGKRVPILWKADYITYKEKINIWHWWNPKLQSDIMFLNNPLKFGLSMNIASVGIDEYVETTNLYIASIGVSSNFKDDLNINFFPLKHNLGANIPLISNLNIGLGLSYKIIPENSIGFVMSIGFTH